MPLIGGGVTMETFKLQILGCLVSGKNSESVRMSDCSLKQSTVPYQ